MKVYIGADHRGFELKEKIKRWFGSSGIEVVDCGNSTYDPDDDFPDFALAVADAVAGQKDDFGIVICGSGGGAAIAANKVNGIRCAQGINEADVIHNRQHDDINVLAVGADFVPEEAAIPMVQAFLSTAFLARERFLRRIGKISARE